MGLSLDDFAQQLTACGLLSAEEMAVLRSDSRAADAETFARGLVKQKKLTAYQAQQAYSGKAKMLVLGNYVIVDKLGQGGMGLVLKAQHRRMKRTVAIKVLSPTVTKTKELVARFQREVQAVAKLEHPNIVAAYDADEAHGTHFFVMQYVDGKDLSTLVKSKGPLPAERAVGCIVQAARGLEYAHKRGIVHRDIKPANLLIDAEGTVKILDMGLARIEGETGTQAELTSTGAIMGTIDYMAPEQALNTKSADARSDIYSLGITLWYLLVGRPAFEGDSLMARMLAHREAPIPSVCTALGSPGTAVPGIIKSIDNVFQKMVAKNAADRFQSMTEVVAALEATLRGDAASLPSLSLPSSEDSRFSAFLAGLEHTQGGTHVAAAKQTKSGRTAIEEHTAPAEPTLSISASDAQTDPQTLHSLTPRRKVQRPARPIWWQDRRVYIGGAIAAALVLCGGIVLMLPTPRGTIRVEINDPNVAVQLQGTEIKVTGADPQPIRIHPGEYAFVVTRGDFSFETKSLTLKKNETVAVSIDWRPDRVVAMANGELLGSKTHSKPPSAASPVAETSPTPGPWVALFDGFYAGSEEPRWRALGPFRTQNRLLVASTAGLAITAEEFLDFELEFDWKISEGGNSGVYYRNPATFLNAAAVPGIEYQLLDNAGHPNGRSAATSAAALYGLISPSTDATHPAGEFNTSRIVANGNRVEHWLNGTKVVAYDSSLPEFQSKAQATKFADRFPARPVRGPIALQGHTGTVSFRKIRIRELIAPAVIPADARAFQGHWYRFVREQLSWKDAKRRCEETGGHLVIIDSAAENEFVSRLIEAAGRSDAWIGMTDEAKEGRWMWVNGKPAVWTNWFTNQPNNKGGLEHYALMSKGVGDVRMDWQWADQPNESQQHQPGYVCEWDAASK